MKKNSKRVAGIVLIVLGFYNINQFMSSEHNKTLGIISGVVLVLIGAYSLFITVKNKSIDS